MHCLERLCHLPNALRRLTHCVRARGRRCAGRRVAVSQILLRGRQSAGAQRRSKHDLESTRAPGGPRVCHHCLHPCGAKVCLVLLYASFLVALDLCVDPASSLPIVCEMPRFNTITKQTTVSKHSETRVWEKKANEWKHVHFHRNRCKL